jgi:dihydrofolate reductase
MNSPVISIIGAMSQNRVIGDRGALPWSLPTDMKWFRNTTRGHPVIMGRKTFETLTSPLPNRANIIVTRDTLYSANGCTVFDTIQKAIDFAKTQDENEIFIIGGGEIYSQSLEIADRLYITVIEKDFEGDAFFPKYEKIFTTVTMQIPFEENNLNATIYTLEK